MSLPVFYNLSEQVLANNTNTTVTATVILSLATNFFLRRNDVPSPPNINNSHYDFIIVGAGSAGSVVANRLSEIGDWNILLLEAGEDSTEIDDVPAYKSYLETNDSTIVWRHFTQPESATCSGDPCFWPAGKVLGGTSTINTLLYARGFKGDYDHWARLGNHGWHWSSALHYFKKSENNLDPIYARDRKYHSTGGYLGVQTFPYHDVNTYNVIKAYEELGYHNTDYNGPQPTGIFLVQGIVKDGVRQSTNNAFLRPFRNRTNLHIATGIRVTNLIINSSKVVKGIEYVLDNDHSQRGQIFANTEVILSAGTLSSPQILMLSGIGPNETLSNLGIKVIKDSKVGYNLQNHATSVGVNLNLTNTSTVPTSNQQWLDDMRTYIQDHNGPLSAIGLSQMSGYFPSSYATDDFPDIKYGFSFSDVDTEGIDIPSSYYSKLSIGPYMVRPKSRGLFTINSTDPFAPPLIYPRLLTDPHDREVLLQGHLLAMKIARTRAFHDAGYILDTTKIGGCEQEEFGTREYFLCAIRQYVGSAHHYAGTCKMGPWHDRDAVVDPRLRVYGVERLRVIDASIAPQIPSANTNAPSIMIGEKASDIIKQDYNRH